MLQGTDPRNEAFDVSDSKGHVHEAEDLHRKGAERERERDNKKREERQRERLTKNVKAERNPKMVPQAEGYGFLGEKVDLVECTQDVLGVEVEHGGAKEGPVERAEEKEALLLDDVVAHRNHLLENEHLQQHQQGGQNDVHIRARDDPCRLSGCASE